ncbi:MAG: type II toxin-antitoxin system antitoxin SocA domain-containing protein [Erythrobacter sp.]
MGYSAKAIANTMLDIAEAHGETLSPLKLLKLVYIAHGWHLGFTKEPLVEDELAEAWQYGPVFPGIYHEFKKFGRSPIRGRATEIEFPDIGSNGEIDLNPSVATPCVEKSDAFVMQLLEKVWSQYGRYSAIALSNLTHKEQTPWHRKHSDAENLRNVDIPNEMIEEHYSELVNANRVKREASGAAR